MTNMDLIGDRFKDYENVNRNYLTIRTPVIIRLDGKGFSQYTKNFQKPWSTEIRDAFICGCVDLYKNIQGLKLIFLQSDELSLLITDYDNLKTSSWFDKNIQKMVSVSSSILTASFNKYMWENKITNKTGYFDSRTFILPKEEVNNYFIFRQQDSSRNSISSLAQQYFSHKQLQNKSSKDKQNMLIKEKIDWHDLDVWKKRGYCVLRNKIEKNNTIRHVVEPDWNIPIFSEDRNYINKFVYLENNASIISST